MARYALNQNAGAGNMRFIINEPSRDAGWQVVTQQLRIRNEQQNAKEPSIRRYGAVLMRRRRAWGR